jgi:hypothetical protein
VKSVLLLGGYGGFGSRIAQRLAASGYDVIVAGRNLSKAKAFCAGRPSMRPLRIDLRAGISDALARERPWAVVDAAGPFQHSRYDVPAAAVAAGCHYLDIADARAFVCGIGALAEAAAKAGVSVIAGASTEPALTSAVARALARNLQEVRAVEIALSVSNRAGAGRSVSRAVLSYAGRPIRLWRGGRWTEAFGGQELRKQRYAVKAQPPMRRSVALIDVPSLELLPARLTGKPSTSFRAGVQSDVQNLGLWVLSWPVRWGWIGSLEPLQSFIRPGQRLSARLGEDRSAMVVRLFGISGERWIERRWTIIASRDDGREIPCLAIPILLRKIADGDLPAGACDAGGLLELADFEPDLATLSVIHETYETKHMDALYSRVMKRDFGRLPAAVRQMHQLFRDKGATGRATVIRGRGLIPRLIAAVMRFPGEGEHELHVHFAERDGIERWTRCFSGRCFHSHLSQWGSLLVERFGPLSFGFELRIEGAELHMFLRRWLIGPLPLPLALAPRSLAREWEEDGRFHFDVPIALPWAGLLVHYHGWLEPADGP